MFLPTKAHTKEIVEHQYKIRLGNRVPKDAVNLAYAHTPSINSMENVLITDLSNTILENTRNERPEDLFMYPNNALLLYTDDGRFELPTDDALITNVFKDGVPLYYSYQLTYRHYDNKGPDPYGIYYGNGITLIDRFGNPVKRPYQIQLIPDTQNLHLYYVIVYTSFNDKQGDDYRVLYNAVDTKEDGRIETIAGHREPLILQRAFQRVQDSRDLLALIEKKEIFPVYYKSSGEQTAHSKLYVPTPQIKDTRTYEKFRYQLGIEITTPKDRVVFSTPWYSESVINANYLNPDEREGYVNGFKKITNKTVEAIMRGFAPHRYFEDDKIIRKYFVNIDHPKVKESMRIDGSSELYVNTQTEYAHNNLFVPKHARTIKTPVQKSGTVSFRARPLYAHHRDTLYLSFVMDTSESMGVHDPEKVLRMKIMESLMYSARQYYKQNQMNGFLFNHVVKPIREEFSTGEEDLITKYSQAMIDSDVTNPIPALDQALDAITGIPSTYKTNEGTSEELEWRNQRSIVLVTDGEFGDLHKLNERIAHAKANDILISVITYRNFEAINQICINNDVICIDATSPRLAMELRYFFFQLAGMNEYLTVAPDLHFEMTPDDNEKSLYFIHKNTFPIPPDMQEDADRFGIEIVFDPHSTMPELTVYLQDSTTRMVEGTINGSNILTMESLSKDRSFQVLAHSEAYAYSFSPTYAVRFNDRRKIELLPPREIKGDHSWYLRIRNGRFDRTLMDQTQKPTYHYAIPEYYRQSFLEKGHPYRQIKRERPTVVNTHQLRLRHTPLFVEFDGDEVTNAKVVVNGKPLRIKNWTTFDGVIEVDGAITHNDEVYVDYQYEEDSYIYRGYYDEKENRFWQLDLNPSLGHYITIRDTIDGEIKNVPSLTLIDKAIYLYMRPSARIERGANGSIRPPKELQKYTLYHSFEKVSDPNSVLLGEVRVRPSSSQWNIDLRDTRTRGGGLKEEITREIMNEFEEESSYYWDIGHWDGEPFPENGVIAVRVTQSILREHGGQFTKAEVEDKLDRYLGYGILPIIEYVDDPDSLLQIPEDLVVEVIDVDETGELVIKKPTFALNVEGE